MRARRALAALLAAGALGTASAHAAAPVRLTASFAKGARLGGSSALNLGLHIDARRETSPVVSVRLAYADGLGVVLSGLGLASCEPPAIEFAAILSDTSGLGGCPPNSVMALGSVRAEVRLLRTGQVIPEYASTMVLSGPIANGRLRLVTFIDGERPFGGRFLLSGEAADAAPPFGGALVVGFPQVRSLEDVATVSLTDLQLSIGSPQIAYVSHGRPYRPGGIALPTSCPRGGFPFSVALRFKGQRRPTTARTAIPCNALVRQKA